MIGHSKITHKITREAQNNNEDKYHHPKEKILQLERFNNYLIDADILEVFGGQGNPTWAIPRMKSKGCTPKVP